jgi:hypothetical protein
MNEFKWALVGAALLTVLLALVLLRHGSSSPPIQVEELPA